MSVDPRRARIARNEASFREINERLEGGLRRVRPVPEMVEFVCECGNSDCDAIVRLSLEEYESVRADSRHFAVMPGHGMPDTEQVVGGTERFEVVEKQGGAVAIVDAADPRSDGDEGRRRDDDDEPPA